MQNYNKLASKPIKTRRDLTNNIKKENKESFKKLSNIKIILLVPIQISKANFLSSLIFLEPCREIYTCSNFAKRGHQVRKPSPYGRIIRG